MEKTKKQTRSSISTVSFIPPLQAFVLHLLCGLGLALAFWVARNVYSVNLIADPAQTLRLIWVIEAPIVILLFSIFRQSPNQCSYMKAVGRGFVGLPAGAIINALGAIALGAPVSIQYFTKTVNWSIMMSVFTFTPAASVYGSVWTDWQRIFAHTMPNRLIDYMICLPAHGAVIGAWFGAWPIPLDWERPWQCLVVHNFRRQKLFSLGGTWEDPEGLQLHSALPNHNLIGNLLMHSPTSEVDMLTFLTNACAY